MWGLPISVDLSLAGMMVEILGALLLAVDAIGIVRVNKWAEAPGSVASKFADLFSGRPNWATLVAVLLVVMATLIAGFVGMQFEWLAKRMGPWGNAVRLLLGVSIGILSMEVVHRGLLLLTRLMHKASSMTEERTAGIYGALMLIVGFALQFLGAVGQAMK
jgi:hypothetical protein